MDNARSRLLCSFRLGEHWFGLDALSVREISGRTACTPIPLAPAAVRGYINLRGQLHLALDLRGLLGMPVAQCPADGQLIVLKPVAGESIAVFVDSVGDMVEVGEEQIERPAADDEEAGIAPSAAARHAGLIWGLAKLDAGLMTVVDPRQFLPSLAREIKVQ